MRLDLTMSSMMIPVLFIGKNDLNGPFITYLILKDLNCPVLLMFSKNSTLFAF